MGVASSGAPQWRIYGGETEKGEGACFKQKKKKVRRGAIGSASEVQYRGLISAISGIGRERERERYKRKRKFYGRCF